MLFVCAAGNTTQNLDKDKIYPASYEFDNLLSVTAIDNTAELYEFSGYGLSVDIAAPGKDVYVLLPEGDTTFVDGTSIAVSFVSAAAALIKSYDYELAPVEIKRILISNVKKVESLEYKCNSGGYLDIGEALDELISK